MKVFPFLLFLLFGITNTYSQIEQANLLGTWSDPTLVGSTIFNNAYNEIWGVAVDGREYAVIGTTEGTHFIDVTDPSNPEQVELVRGNVSGRSIIHRDYHDNGCFLYVVADEPGSPNASPRSTLQILDISTLPESAKVVYDSDELIFRAHNIFIDEPNDRMYAFIVDGGNIGFSAMRVYDISNPADPEFLAAYNDLSGLSISQVHDGYVLDNMAYLNLGPNGFAIVDFTDPLSPVLLGTLDNYPEQGYNHSGWLSQDGQYYYMSDETHGLRMKVVDVSDPSDIEVVGFFNAGNPATTSVPHNQIVACDYLYVSYYYDGLQVYDISNPSAPVRIAEFDTSLLPDRASFEGAWGVYPFLPSGNILVADMQEGLFVFEAIDGSDCVQRRAMCRTPVSTSAILSNETISVQPNPASDFFTIEFSTVFEGEVSISLRDLAGKTLLKKNILDAQDKIRISLPSQLASGLYLVSIQSDSHIYTKKLIVE